MSLPDPHADGTGAPRHRFRRFLRSRRRLLASAAAVALALGLSVPLALTASATVSSDSGFEAADGNLAVDTPGNMDWNSFAPTTWTGTAPYRTSAKVVNGWAFTGLEDAQATTSDNAFAGGTKQDDNCATVTQAKAPNKDDLKRVYVSSNTVNGDVFLNLAWVRIPQNTTSPSAHIGFEFNQGSTACPATSDGLVQRTAGDILIVYDFTGGSTDTPSITLRKWVTSTSGACEVGSDSPPCWGPSTDLTALGYAEAKVNTSTVGPVTDEIAPSPPETLGLNEFGEAGINLTDAGVFGTNVCTAFGKAYAVSRSSGNSATAQMKDLVGPGNVNISNCGRVIIRKVTDPSPDPTNTSFGYTTTGGLSPSTFSLKNGESQDYGSTVFAGSYSVTETDPASLGFDFTSLDCSASDTSHGTSVSTSGATVSFDLKALDTVDCTYTNTLRQGAIKITKTSSKAAATPLSGAKFSITGPGGYSNTVTTGTDGSVCVDALVWGDYTVTETAAPPGYEIDDSTGRTVTVNNNAKCSDSTFVGETESFTDTPLTDISATATSQVPGGTQSKITCVDASNANVGNSPQGFAESVTVTAKGLKPGTYTCTIVIDP